MNVYFSKRKTLLVIMCALLMLMTLGGCKKESEPEVKDTSYRSLLLAFDYGDDVTYVIGHKNPDSDTVGCAMAYANLLNELGIKAQAAVSGEVNGETAYALETFGIKAPAIIDNAEGKQFVLVDHSTYRQAIDGMDKARVVGIVDHHGIGDVTTSEQINVISAPAGAAASLVYRLYQQCDVPVNKDMARIMLMSIISDTRNMKRNVTEVDQKAYDELTGIAEIEDIDGMYLKMAEALASYGDMTDWEIFQSDYKEYAAGDISFCIGDVNAYGEENVKKLAERMYQVMADNYESMGLDMLFTMINNKNEEDGENLMYMVAYGPEAAEVLQEVYGNYDGNMFFVFKENLSRKADVVPALSAALEKRGNLLS